MSKPTLGIIGAGKVGTTLARLCAARGYVVNAVHSRHVSNSVRLANSVGAEAVKHPYDVVNACDLTLLAVPDDVIADVCKEILAGVGGVYDRTCAVIHTSGAHHAGVLSPLKALNIMVGGLHPAYPFANADAAIIDLPKRSVTFAIETTELIARDWLDEIALSLNGRVLHVSAETKAIYHAALAIASNYTVTLYALAQRLIESVGADRETATGALDGLVAGTVENLRVQGVPDALTGALSRGDVGTVAAHLDALQRIDTDVLYLYITLARQTYPILRARGVDVEAFEQLFKKAGTTDALNRPRYSEDESES